MRAASVGEIDWGIWMRTHSAPSSSLGRNSDPTIMSMPPAPASAASASAMQSFFVCIVNRSIGAYNRCRWATSHES